MVGLEGNAFEGEAMVSKEKTMIIFDMITHAFKSFADMGSLRSRVFLLAAQTFSISSKTKNPFPFRLVQLRLSFLRQ